MGKVHTALDMRNGDQFVLAVSPVVPVAEASQDTPVFTVNMFTC